MGIQSQYYWVAVYKDNTELRQFEGTSENLFKDIDQNRLKTFKWVSTEDKPTYSINIKPWQRLIAFRRVRITGSGRVRQVIYALGWQCTIKGRNIKTINWIYPDGSIIVDDNI